MKSTLTIAQREQISDLLEAGHPRDFIAQAAGVTPGQVSALSAHRTMKAMRQVTVLSNGLASETGSPEAEEAKKRNPLKEEGHDALLLGWDRTGTPVYWNPVQSVNPHVMILGESGFGKTYSTSCLIAELTRSHITSIIFDYGQGFTADSAHPTLLALAKPQQFEAARLGIHLNPFEILPSDLHGPLSVAQRIADTLGRVFPGIGIQQNAAIRDSIISLYKEAGIHSQVASSWHKPVPRFGRLRDALNENAEDPGRSDRNVFRTAASHISSLFVFDVFRGTGVSLPWTDLLRQANPVVIQLRGLEQNLQRAITELLLWNLMGLLESIGPGPLRTIIVIDEAHRMPMGAGSAVEKLLREGRKFGAGVILASQQPEDFTPVAFSNTATKLVFQISDHSSTVAKQLFRKLRTPIAFPVLCKILTTLERGNAFAISNNEGAAIRVATFEERFPRY